jgi:hypothetical protein
MVLVIASLVEGVSMKTLVFQFAGLCPSVIANDGAVLMM